MKKCHTKKENKKTICNWHVKFCEPYLVPTVRIRVKSRELGTRDKVTTLTMFQGQKIGDLSLYKL